MATIELGKVDYRRGDRRILDGVELRIDAGMTTAVVGPSGAGKSTLLRLIAGLERPTAGTVRVGGLLVDGSPPPRMAMVFEGDGLYEHLDVGSQLEFPSRMQHMPRPKIRSVAQRAARWMRISRLWQSFPSGLSGGERNMVAVARAVARDELDLLLLDEPLSRADRHARQQFRLDLRRLAQEAGLTVVLATNDQEEAMAVADRLVVLIDGSVAQVGPPLDIFDRPVSTAVASFIGPLPMNLFPATVVTEAGRRWLAVATDRVALDQQVQVADGEHLLVGLHAHELRPVTAGTPFGRSLTVTVAQVQDLGATVHIRFGLGVSPAGVFVTTENRPAAVRPGDRLELTWVPGRLRLFAADTGRAIPM